MLERCFAEAVEILENNRALLDEISSYLLIKETITGAEMMAIINNEHSVAIEDGEAQGAIAGESAPEGGVSQDAPAAPEASPAENAAAAAPENAQDAASAPAAEPAAPADAPQSPAAPREGDPADDAQK